METIEQTQETPAAVTMPERLVYTRAEVQHVLSIGETTVWRLEKRKIIQPLPGLGRHKLYSVAAIRRLAEKGFEVAAS